MIAPREFSRGVTVTTSVSLADMVTLRFQLARRTWNAMIPPIFGERWRVELVRIEQLWERRWVEDIRAAALRDLQADPWSEPYPPLKVSR